MPRLIWVFTGRTVTLLVLSCRGSFLLSAVPIAIILCFSLLHFSPFLFFQHYSSACEKKTFLCHQNFVCALETHEVYFLTQIYALDFCWCFVVIYILKHILWHWNVVMTNQLTFRQDPCHVHLHMILLHLMIVSILALQAIVKIPEIFTKLVSTMKTLYGRHHDLVYVYNVVVSRIISYVFALTSHTLRKRLRIRSVISVNYHYITVLCPFNLLIRFQCYKTV